MAIYKGEGGAYEIISFTITDIDESEEVCEGYAVEYADEEDIEIIESFDDLSEANEAFYSDEKGYFKTLQKKENECDCVCSYVRECVICERDTGRILAVSHGIPEDK